MSDYLLEAREVTVRFGRGADAFDAVHKADVCLRPGEVIGIVGESGSGKTTLARVLVGLQRPTEGAVYLEDTRIFTPDSAQQLPRSERWKIQMIFQDPYSSLNPRLRVWQTVAEAVQVWQGVSGAAAKTEALKLLADMGVTGDQAHRFPRALSGGQRQRISTARALAPHPKILIADEPTSAIDQSAQAQLLNLLRRLQTDRGLSIIFISHDLGLVRYLTQRVYVMQKGVVVEAGETQTVFDGPQHPYTQMLIESIPSRAAKAVMSNEG